MEKEEHGKECRCKECIKKWKRGIDISDSQIDDYGQDIRNGMTWRF
jgi:hypothetical protein